MILDWVLVDKSWYVRVLFLFHWLKWKLLDLDLSPERRQRSARPGGVSDPLEQDQEVAGESCRKHQQLRLMGIVVIRDRKQLLRDASCLIYLCRESSESSTWTNRAAWTPTRCVWLWKTAVTYANAKRHSITVPGVFDEADLWSVLRVQTQQQAVSDADRSIRRQRDHRLRQLHLLPGQTGVHVQYVQAARGPAQLW